MWQLLEQHVDGTTPLHLVGEKSSWYASPVDLIEALCGSELPYSLFQLDRKNLQVIVIADF